MNRRRFLAATAGAGTVLVAGCTGNGSSDSPSGNGGNGGSAMGTFRLLISDQPADIGDFDSLDVTLSKARVFRAADDEEDDDSDDDDGTETPEGTETAEPTETEEPTETPEGTEPEEAEDDEDDEENGEDDEDGEGGFTELDLEGETVDLTQVIGDKAISVLEGELEAGTYTKIELHASDVVGIVDGEEVDVKLPSEKLQITKTFEVEEGEEVSFVFDIHVVKRGPNNGYILRPVISESGVAGKDVEVEEVNEEDDDDEDEEDDENEDGTETAEPTETPETTDAPESAGNESA